jgi:hypothetical protein
MSRARRPPRLEPSPAPPAPAPVTPGEMLERARVAGRGTGMGPAELRRAVARVLEGDRVAQCGLELEGVEASEVHRVLWDVFGASVEQPTISPDATLAGATRAGRALAEQLGGSVLAATARPASLFSLLRRLVTLASTVGACVVDVGDSGSIRVDGRRDRRLRFVDGVACVTDGDSLLAVRGPEAAVELEFLVPRPTLVVADGVFATHFAAAGVRVIAFVGLEAFPLAVAAMRGAPVTVVPLEVGRPPGAYAPVAAAAESAAGEGRPRPVATPLEPR